MNVLTGDQGRITYIPFGDNKLNVYDRIFVETFVINPNVPVSQQKTVCLDYLTRRTSLENEETIDFFDYPLIEN